MFQIIRSFVSFSRGKSGDIFLAEIVKKLPTKMRWKAQII